MEGWPKARHIRLSRKSDELKCTFSSRNFLQFIAAIDSTNQFRFAEMEALTEIYANVAGRFQ